jgi:hypothetical protein
MIPREEGSGSLHSSAKPARSISAPSLSTPTRHPVRKGYSRSPLPAPTISPQDDARERRHFQNQANASKIAPKPTPKPAPTISPQDDARENRRFLNQANASKIAPKPTPKPAPTISPQDDARERRHFQNQANASKIAPKPAPGTGNGGERSWETHSLSKDIFVGSAIGFFRATRESSSPPLHRAQDVLSLADERRVLNLNQAGLESRLRASEWYQVEGRWAKNPEGTKSRIWTNPSLTESIRITPKPNGDIGLRAYNGPSGGVVDALRTEPQNQGWTNQGRPGDRTPTSLAKESLIDAQGRTGSGSGHTYPNNAIETHFRLQSSPSVSVAKVALRGASRAALPVAAAIDAYDLTRTYQNGGNTPEFRSQAAGVAGGWAGAAAGAQLGATIGSFVPIPGVGTVAGGLIGGGIGYLVGSGVASELEEGVEEAAPKVWEGAKSAWNSVFG